MRRRVAALLALCLLAAIPALARTQGVGTACKSNLKNIGTACELYATDNGGRYPPTLAVLTPNYLKTIPTCPAARADTYSEGFVSGTSPDRFAVYCLGSHHTKMGMQPNRPSFDSINGLLELGDSYTRCQSQLQEAARALSLHRKHDARHQYPKDFKSLAFPSPPSPILYASDGNSYTMMCGGALHVEDGIAPFSPQRTSAAGPRVFAVPLVAPAAGRPHSSGVVRAFVAAMALLSVPLAWAALRPRK